VLAAICIPTFSKDALSWLQELRSTYDPEYFRLVAPHVTLVFPNSELSEDSLIAHVSSCTQGVNGTTVKFASAREFRDESTGLELVYLVPGAGSDWFHRLHQKLYSGALGAVRRRDIQFLPHITLGRFSSASEAATLAAKINSEKNQISGQVEAIDVVNVGENLVRHVYRQSLGVG